MNDIINQIMEANKTAYENAINTMVAFHGKTEEMMKASMENLSIPEEAKTVIMQAGSAYKNILNQILDINKNGYENVVKAIATSQEKAEEMVKISLESTPLPDEAKKAVLKAMDTYKEGYSRVQQAVEDNYMKIEKIINS